MRGDYRGTARVPRAVSKPGTAAPAVPRQRPGSVNLGNRRGTAGALPGRCRNPYLVVPQRMTQADLRDLRATLPPSGRSSLAGAAVSSHRFRMLASHRTRAAETLIDERAVTAAALLMMLPTGRAEALRYAVRAASSARAR